MYRQDLSHMQKTRDTLTPEQETIRRKAIARAILDHWFPKIDHKKRAALLQVLEDLDWYPVPEYTPEGLQEALNRQYGNPSFARFIRRKLDFATDTFSTPTMESAGMKRRNPERREMDIWVRLNAPQLGLKKLIQERWRILPLQADIWQQNRIQNLYAIVTRAVDAGDLKAAERAANAPEGGGRLHETVLELFVPPDIEISRQEEAKHLELACRRYGYTAGNYAKCAGYAGDIPSDC